MHIHSSHKSHSPLNLTKWQLYPQPEQLILAWSLPTPLDFRAIMRMSI